MEQAPEVMRGVQYWIDAIKNAKLYDKIPHFNDIISGKSKPSDDIKPVLENVQTADKICDIYHWGGTSERIYLHIKD